MENSNPPTCEPTAIPCMVWLAECNRQYSRSKTSPWRFSTGGYAYARLETDTFAAAGPAAATLRLHETRTGWTVGGGTELAFAPGWSAKLEYLYLDFGSRSTAIAFVPLPMIVDNAHFTMNVVRAGINYRF
jgi:outer membrane immunogenic protein